MLQKVLGDAAAVSAACVIAVVLASGCGSSDGGASAEPIGVASCDRLLVKTAACAIRERNETTRKKLLKEVDELRADLRKTKKEGKVSMESYCASTIRIEASSETNKKRCPGTF